MCSCVLTQLSQRLSGIRVVWRSTGLLPDLFCLRASLHVGCSHVGAMGGDDGGGSRASKLISGAAKGTGKLAAGTTKVAVKTSAAVAEGLAEGAWDAARDGRDETQEVPEGEENEEGEGETADERELGNTFVKGAARGTGKLAVSGTKVAGKAAGKIGAEAGKRGADLTGEAVAQVQKQATKPRAYHGPYCCCSRPYDTDQRRWNPEHKQPGQYSNPLATADESEEDED